jgi:hypothetical protein
MSQFDPYLKVCKTKPLPVLSKQQVFDMVIRKMVSQGFPSVRRDDATQSYHLASFATLDGVFRASPLLCLLSHEEITKLQKATDYHRLQGYTQLSAIQSTWNDTTTEDMKKLKSRLELIGIDDSWFVFLAASLLPAHTKWWMGCFSANLMGGAGIKANRNAIMFQLYESFLPVTKTHLLDQSVLDWASP